jgi:hypothetical protein
MADCQCWMIQSSGSEPPAFIYASPHPLQTRLDKKKQVQPTPLKKGKNERK